MQQNTWREVMTLLKKAITEICSAISGLSAQGLDSNLETIRIITAVTTDMPTHFSLPVGRVLVIYDFMPEATGALRVLGLLHTDSLPSAQKRLLVRLESKFPLNVKLMSTWDFGYSLSDDNLIKAKKDPLYSR